MDKHFNDAVNVLFQLKIPFQLHYKLHAFGGSCFLFFFAVEAFRRKLKAMKIKSKKCTQQIWQAHRTAQTDRRLERQVVVIQTEHFWAVSLVSVCLYCQNSTSTTSKTRYTSARGREVIFNCILCNCHCFTNAARVNEP